MDCSRRRFPWRGLEFHVCTINKGAHSKEVWKLIQWSSYHFLVWLKLFHLHNSKWTTLPTHSCLVFYISSLHSLIVIICLLLFQPSTQNNICPVGWGCRIHRLHLCSWVRPLPKKCPGYDTKNLMLRFQWCWDFIECGAPFNAITPRSTLARNGSTW